MSDYEKRIQSILKRVSDLPEEKQNEFLRALLKLEENRMI